MFGHMANENRNSPWKRCLCLTQTRVNVQSSLIIGMNHRSDGPDYGIVLEDTYVCQRVSEFINSPDEGLVSELTSSIQHGLWKGCDRKLFLRGKNYSEVCTMEGIGNVKAAVTYMSLVHIWAHVTLQTHDHLLVHIMGDQSHIFKAPLNLWYNAHIWFKFKIHQDSKMNGTNNSIQHSNNHGHMQPVLHFLQHLVTWVYAKYCISCTLTPFRVSRSCNCASLLISYGLWF